jgi:hypothetical protein
MRPSWEKIAENRTSVCYESIHTFKKDERGVVTPVLPNTSRVCFEGDAIARLRASKIAMVALTCTAAFLPMFLSYFGDFTESIISVTRRAAEVGSCRGNK